MWYNLFGTINTLFIFVSLYGVFLQLNKIWARKKDEEPSATNVLSQNQFTMSFLAYFSFFIYGYSIEPLNHYIVWPRLIASILVTLILFEMWLDRKSKTSYFCILFIGCSFIFGITGFIFKDNFSGQSENLSTILILVITFLLAQGYIHQIKLIMNTGNTGAIDIRMSQFILMMDVSTIAFAISMGISQGWPLIVLALVSGITKIIIMYLFRWVRISPLAEFRRAYNKSL
ncbi:hypothetical protein HJP15_02155 [Pseudoalteromonas sp. NEC-BIFX-2020_002]|uniref:hypothetical protein n=1 Tax=Pseudoalteromonas sp. NEC-BIFX-2020_002 TaxID=2732353 RepID=UPI0014776611|nr:hypothetical protein [Pseudoalteromonas sp. NEC-BIFX-2020_002]NNG41754.1 hypothetical protein [Pseudoalteromonas sp. NEC-BIFX-2020_002]